MKERKGEVIRDAFGQQKDIDVQRLGFRRVTSELAHVPKLISITVAHRKIRDQDTTSASMIRERGYFAPLVD